MPFFKSIHGLRGIAALLVVFYHYGAVTLTLEHHGIGNAPALLRLGNLATFGAVGVPIFFVISGFVMGLQRFEPGLPAVGDFVLRRLIRIVPFYWVMTLVYWAVGVDGYSAIDLWASLGFVHQLQGSPPVIRPGWTLEYEMFFYLCFALVVTSGAFGPRKWSLTTLALLFLGLCAANFVFAGPFLAIYANPLLLEFLLGVGIAQIYGAKPVRQFWPVCLVVAIALFIISIIAEVGPGPMNLLWGGGAFFAVLGLVGAERDGRPLLTGRLADELGSASYAIYLSHALLVLTLFVWPLWYLQLPKLLEPHVTLFLLIVTGVCFGWLVHRLLEAPLNTWLRRRVIAGDEARLDSPP